MSGSGSDYQGWTNYPTWCVNLWLSNERALYDEAWARVADTMVFVDHDDENVKSGIWSVSEARRFRVADDFESWVVDDLAPDVGASFGSDLLGYALGEVDWHQIADAWIADVAAQAGEES